MIEREMEQTRASLVEKVAALEQQVVGTLQTATSTVKETVESVKDTVTNVREAVTGTVESVKDSVETSVETVTDSVKDAFDLRTHIRHYPWACVGAATAAGFGVGLLLGNRGGYAASAAGLKSSSLYDTYRRENGPSRSAAPMAATMSSAADSYHEPARPAAAPEPRRPGMFDQLFSKLSDEITRLGEEAFHTLTQSLRSQLSTALPQMIENVVASGTHAMQNAVSSAVGAHGPTDNPRGEQVSSRHEPGYRG